MHLEQVVRPVAHMTLATAREPGAKKSHQMSGATVNQGSMQALDPGACLGAVYAAAVMGASSAAPPRRESEVAGPGLLTGRVLGERRPPSASRQPTESDVLRPRGRSFPYRRPGATDLKGRP